MTPAEQKALTTTAVALLAASLLRFGWEARRGPRGEDMGESVLDSLLVKSDRAREEEERRSRPLADGERLDPNSAPAIELDRLPGVGPSLAARIVENREALGPFPSLQALDRVRGIGPASLARLGPHLTLRSAARSGTKEPSRPSRSFEQASRGAGSPMPATIDLNRATPGELEDLPGVGPALAERIVQLRRRKGGFRRVEDLLEVRGIGPVSLRRLADHVRVGS